MTTVERVLGYVPAITSGMFATASLSAVAIVLGFVAAVGLHGLATRGGPVVRAGVRSYVSFFRGTPLLVQLLMSFYLPAGFGFDLKPELAAIVALGLNSAAFQSEILRSGFAAIPFTQIEAARVFGLSSRRILWHIQLPQVVRITLPSLTSEAVDIIKGSAVISVIAIADLMRVGKQLVAVSFRPLEVYLCVAVAYALLTTAIVVLGRTLDHRLRTGVAA